MNIVIALFALSLLTYGGSAMLDEIRLTWRGWRKNKWWYEPLTFALEWVGLFTLALTLLVAMAKGFSGTLI